MSVQPWPSWVPVLLVGALAACGGSTSTPPATDDTSVSGDDSTPVGDDTEDDDTFKLSTGDPFADSDTDNLVSSGFLDDSAACTYGEIADCNGICFPSYMVGDGYCDDGDPLPADFNCTLFRFDRGDCAADSGGTGLLADACDYEVKFHVASWSNEISWELQDPGGTIITGINAGSYVENNRVYEHPVRLVDGTYVFYGFDSFGDGWHGGFWELVDKRTGRSVFTGTGFGGSQFTWEFEVECPREPGCTHDIHTIGGTDADQMSWELFTSGDEVAADLIPGQAADGTTRTQSVTVFDGTYDLSARDAGNNGWQGGIVEVRTQGGALIDAHAVRSGRREDIRRVQIDCRLEDAEAIDTTPPPTLTPSTCSGVEVVTTTAADGAQVGFTLIRAQTWASALNNAAGAFNDDGRVENRVNVEDGLYFLRLTDAGRNGWQGAQVTIQDPGDDSALFSTTLPDGASGGVYVVFDCPEPPTPTVDTVPTDTTPPVAECLPGAQRDCNGTCFPTVYVGDGTCDDGTQFAVDFDCQDFDNDGGDCVQ